MNKKDEFLTRLVDIRPNIIGLTEMKAKNQVYSINTAEYEIPNYDLFLNADPKRGIALYFDKSLNAKECDEFQKSGFEESLWCTCKGANEESVLIGCVYRSPSSSLENTENLYKLLKHEGLSKYGKICIIGDFNFPNVNWEGKWNGEANNTFIECVRDAFLIQKVTQPTRHRKGQRSTLDDLVLVNDENLVSDIQHLDPVGKSDHDVMLFDLYVSRTKTEKTTKYRFDLNKGDYGKMRELISNYDFSALSKLDVESTWCYIRDLIVDTMEKCIPKKNCGKDRNIKPRWINGEVRKSVKKKYNLYKKYLQSKQARDYQSYKLVRSKCKKLIKKARKSFEKDIAGGCKTNPKQFWKYVQERTKSNTGISALKSGNSGYAVSDEEKAETLNAFFSSVFTDEDKTNVPILSEGEYSKGVTATDIIVTPDAVRKKLNGLDASKAQGPDRIPPRVLKELSNELSTPLCLLFNKSIESGIVPSDWRSAEVTAIFKKGSKSEPGNYRPVSLTCIVCKVLESIIRDTLTSHFHDNNLYANCQHGFRSKRSCMTQLMEVMEDLTTLLDEKNPVDIIYLDFRKAFDSVPHERLLCKLQAYGVTGNILNWIRNFLTGRVQKVRVGNANSSLAEVLSGIPQGSILGPVLFTVFINDLPEGIQSSCKIFADDTKIYDKSGNCSRIQGDLKRLERWTEEWNLYFNVEKCKVMHLGRNNPGVKYTMKMGNDDFDITVCKEEKDLGVTFDTKLSFDPHIQNSINKANQMIGVIKRTFAYLNKDIFTKLYKAIVRPRVEYGNVIWHPRLKRQSAAVERVQRRATKLLSECHDMSYSDRLEYLNLHSLKGRRIRGDLIESYKLYNNRVDVEWSKFFKSSICTSTRNADGKVFITRSNTNLRKHCFSNRVANLWNNLPFQLKTAPTTNDFKNQLDRDPTFTSLFRSYDE